MAFKVNINIEKGAYNNFYEAFNQGNNQRKGKILVLVDDVSEYEKIKDLLPLEFSGGNCQFHLILVSQSGDIEGFDSVKIAAFNDNEIEYLSEIPMVKKLATTKEIKELCCALQFYPLAVMLSISAMKMDPTLSVDKYLAAFRNYSTIDLQQEELIIYDGRAPNPTSASLSEIEKTLGVVFENIERKSKKAFELLGYLSVLNIGEIPIRLIAKLTSMSENELWKPIGILNQFFILQCDRKGQSITLQRLVEVCYKRLYVNSYVNKSYLAQDLINKMFIEMINKERGDSKQHHRFQYPWGEVKSLIHHAVLVGSKVTQSYHNQVEVNMMCNAFYLVGLYNLFNNNPEGALLAVEHLNFVTGNCGYPGGSLFDGRTHDQGKLYLCHMIKKLYTIHDIPNGLLNGYRFSNPQANYVFRNNLLINELQPASRQSAVGSFFDNPTPHESNTAPISSADLLGQQGVFRPNSRAAADEQEETFEQGGLCRVS